MSDYNRVKKFILPRLQGGKSVLGQNEIKMEIQKTKKLMNEIDHKLLSTIFNGNIANDMTENDWKRLHRELETHFDVEMESGIVLQGREQRNRNNVWWSNGKKQRNENYHWEKYKTYIKNMLPTEVVRTIDTDTDVIMDNIENPEINSFERYGMVVGHVQSGKTSNYSALLCKAADAGYKFIVVVAGGINTLRNQTQQRINDAFVGNDIGVLTGVGKLGGIDKSRTPISLTTKELDFNKRDADRNSQGLNFDNITSPIIMVIKKHTKTLENVISWITNQYNSRISKHAMLLIDDESDYASINTKKEEDPTAINEKLRKLLNLFKKSAYVAYTATPYANIFIDHEVSSLSLGKDLFPRDFIYALNAPTNYFGARKIFLDTQERHLVQINDYKEIIPLNHKKNIQIEELPESLYEAIMVFILNISIRYLRHQENKHNSMLIHVSRFTRVHQEVAFYVEEYLKVLRRDINNYGCLEKATSLSKYISKMKIIFDERFDSIEFDWNTVLDKVCGIINTVVVREAHQKSSIKVEYNDNEVTNAIVIGGTSLARGFTLEGLNVSYFLRKTAFYDTLMQMGRWFGYRPGYEDICKIYMTEQMTENFAFIIKATEELIETIRTMKDQKKTPEDFGLAVKQHPDSILKVTARNKLRNAKDYYFEMNLDGHAKETSWIIKDKININKNIESINRIISKLKFNGNEYEKIGKNYVWKDVNRKMILEFLNSYKLYAYDDSGIKSRMPIEFIKGYVKEVQTDWDIALYSGFGKKLELKDNEIEIYKEKRQIVTYQDYYEVKNRQVSSGDAESIALDKEVRKSLGSGRKIIREKLKKPLLMLHILEAEDSKNDTLVEELPAIGVSFPGGINSKKQTIKLKINTVFLQKLMSEEEGDDYEE